MERPEKYKQWQARNQRAGLRQLPLKPAIVNVLKDKAMRCHHKDFLFCEDEPMAAARVDGTHPLCPVGMGS